MADAAQAFLASLQAQQRREEDAPLPRRPEEPTVEIETTEAPPRPAASGRLTPEPGITARNLFRHPDAHPHVLSLVLLRKYGPEWLTWEPETLERAIRDDLGGASDLNFAKIQATKTLHLVDTFWQSWEIFLPCLMALNGLFPDFEMLHPPTVAQCAVAVDIANGIRDDVAWTPEIKNFIATVFRHDDIFCPVEPLEFVTVPIEGAPIDRAEIMKRWPSVRGVAAAPTEDSITGEQLRRMWTVHHYLTEYRERLRRQLPIGAHA